MSGELAVSWPLGSAGSSLSGAKRGRAALDERHDALGRVGMHERGLDVHVGSEERVSAAASRGRRRSAASSPPSIAATRWRRARRRTPSPPLRSCSSGTRRSTKPMRNASSALKRRALHMRSRARLRPTMRGSSQLVPCSATRPRPRERRREARAGCGEPQVAHHRQHEPTACRHAVDRGDHRLRHPQEWLNRAGSSSGSGLGRLPRCRIA